MQPLPVRWRSIAAADAHAIAAWRYEPPYDFYNLGEDAIAELLDPDQGYVVAVAEDDALAGFACFGASAQIPSGRAAGCYDGPMLDLGLGLRPDLTGHGNGARFVSSAMAVGWVMFHPLAFRLSVATFNERAIRAYQRAGFVPRGRCVSVIKQRPVEFLVMTTSSDRVAETDAAYSGDLGNRARTG